MSEIASAYITLYPKISNSFKSDVESGTSRAMSSAGESSGEVFGNGLKGGIGKIAIGNFLGTMLTEGVQMAAGAAAETFKGAFENAGTFEQLSGGVEKIFDQADQSKIFADAQNAYKDLNMSANQYLDSINQVGATFAQTMGDQKGYDTARQGMKAIADYASGTGRNLDELNEKYKLITRASSSYQSIADQFAGILPQTSADFLAQAQAAGLLSTEYTKLTEVPVAEYQQAVTQMLEQGVDKLGLLGNTAAESTGTLTGSIAMLQSSWQNLLTSLGTGENVEESIQAVVDSIGAVMENAIPVIGRILESMGKAIGDFAIRAGDYFMEHRTEIYDKVGQFMQGALQAILTATPYIIEGIVYLVGSMLEYIVTHIPDMLAAGVQLLGAFLEAIVQAITPSMQAMNEVGQAVLDSIGSFINDMFNAGANLIQGFIDGILSAPGAVIDAIGGVVGGAVDEGKRLLGIASPSKVFAQLGEYSMQGYIQGVEGFENATKNAVGGIMSDIAVSASVDNSSSGGVASPIINITVESRGDEDSYELGRRIGQATAYELRMQGVSA